ncbi:hypothetical protein BWK69_01260 [Candidatus Parcubacteria bacterium A4]|nr:MAG: hypothetical protein BWK69_01260 [Candidatus Parcubacteria bacterium A4]
MKIAKENGLKNVWVSNGFFSEKTFDLIAYYLDATNIDLKSSEDKFYIENCGARIQPILDNLIRIKKAGIWLEIATLSIPGLSDSKEMFEKIAKFIKDKLGAETPWHISRFSGEISWKLRDVPDTPLKTLEMAYDIGKKVGLKHIYLGNI